MGFLDGLFETKAAVPKNPLPRATGGTRSLGMSVAGASSWDIDQAITYGYERVIWVYRCVDTIASNAASIPIIEREYDDNTGQVVDDPPLMRLLNRRANPYETAQQFRYRLASQLLLSRRGAFIEVVRNNAGEPTALHLLPPGTTSPIIDPATYVSGYAVQTIAQGLVELPPDRVIWIRVKPHPTDVYAQMTPLVSAGLAVDTDFLARLYNRNFLANDGRPGLLVAVKGGINTEDAEELRRRFSGGPNGAGATSVIEADGIDVEDMGASPRDVMWADAVSGSKEDILLAFGTPESVLGNASGRTWSNAATEEEVFWKATMVPFLDGVAAGFDILTPGGLDDENVVAHDYSTVEALQRQKKERDDRALNEVKAGTMTIDDYLEFVGREPMNVPGTKVLWTPPGLVPVGPDDATTQAAAALAPSGAGQAPPPGGAPPVPGQDMQQVATTTVNQALETQQRAIEDDNAARALRLAGKQSDPFVLARSEPVPALQTKATTDEYPDHPYQVARDITEAQIEAVLAAWSKRQSRVILARLTGTKARKHTRHWSGSPGTKALNSAYITNPEMWAEDLVESLTDVIGAMANTEALRMARQLRDDGVIDRVLADGGGHRPHARTPLDRLIDRDALVDPVRAVEDMIRNSALRQTELIAAHIRMRDAEGADMDTIAKEVDKMINSRSSWHKGLAVAAATTAMEGVRDTVMQAAGPHILRIWRTMRDERVRPTHRVAHGQRRATGRPFLVGGFPLMFPGDPSAPIHETANCFPAGTRVWANDVVGAYRSWYVGDIVTLRTANGNVITGTPNHPVLTPGGWVPIGLLHEGSDLIRTVIGDGAEGTGGVWGDPDVHNRPPVIDEVFDTLAKDRAPMRLPTVAVNFHGDRPAGDVDVVLSDRELRLALDPALLQHPGQLDLIGADPSSGPGVVDGLGASGPFGITHNSVPGRSVGRSGVGASFVSGHSAHAQEIGLTTRTPGDTGLTQAALDRLTVSPVGPSDGKFTLASHVATDHVVSVDVRPFVGHVYNLQTKSGMYAAQGIVVHNCRCWVDYRPQAVRRGGRRIPPSVRPRGTATPPRASRAGMLRAREMAA